MIEHGYREPRPFGRRTEERPHDRATDHGRGGSGSPAWEAPARTAGPLAWALRTAAVAGFAAVFATQYLARVGLPDDLAATRIAQGGRIAAADPETTGSIGRAAARPAPVMPAAAAQSTRLDPCAVAGTARARP